MSKVTFEQVSSLPATGEAGRIYFLKEEGVSTGSLYVAKDDGTLVPFTGAASEKPYVGQGTNAFEADGAGGNTTTGEESVTFGNHNNNPAARGFLAGNNNGFGSGAENSATFGYSNSTAGAKVFTFGSNNRMGDADGHDDFLAGYNNRVTGSNNVALGNTNTVSGQNNVAGGARNVVSGYGSASFGINNTVSGTGSFAAGDGNVATGGGSIALGKGHIVTYKNELAVGRYATESHDKRVFVVGVGDKADGEDAVRKDAVEVFEDGTATLPSSTAADQRAAGDKAIVTVEMQIQVIEATDRDDAATKSAADPTNIYYWSAE